MGKSSAHFRTHTMPIIYSHGDDRLCMVDTETGQVLREVKTEYPSLCIALSPDHTMLCACESVWLGWPGAKGHLTMYDAATLTATIRLGLSQVDAVAFTSDSRRMAVGSDGDGRCCILILLPSSLKKIGYGKGHSQRVTALTYSPSDAFLISTSRDGTARVSTSTLKNNSYLKFCCCFNISC